MLYAAMTVLAVVVLGAWVIVALCAIAVYLSMRATERDFR